MTDISQIIHVIRPKPYESSGDVQVRLKMLLMYLESKYQDYDVSYSSKENITITIKFSNELDAMQFLLAVECDSRNNS